jgi:hypothetical protein
MLPVCELNWLASHERSYMVFPPKTTVHHRCLPLEVVEMMQLQGLLMLWSVD